MNSDWHFYRELDKYRQAPDEIEAERLRAKFVELFSQKTGIDSLDDRISKTLAKKDELLPVVIHPEIELHNRRVRG